jgi:SepF-like predicted cell division protein (DUF552 family)
MSFTDDLKRSLGFEESDSTGKAKSEISNIVGSIKDVLKPKENPNAQRNNSEQQYGPGPQYQYEQAPRPTQSPNPHPQYRPAPVYDDFDDVVIVPEQSFYEIMLIRPKTLDDINYVVDQVVEEKNPVILDLSFLEKESAPNFKLAGDKIKQMRTRYGAQALLLCRSEDKNLIIISPKKVKVINKG